MFIINTGGTFNKYYDPILGNLSVKQDDGIIKTILSSFYNLDYQLKGIIYKDSLEMNDNDRKKILKIINNTKYEKIVIIHGTDTIDTTAIFLEKYIKNKIIIITGSMKPFNIDKTEATSNLSLSIGALSYLDKKGVYIAMGGIVKEHTQYKKNKKLGKFEIIQ